MGVDCDFWSSPPGDVEPATILTVGNDRHRDHSTAVAAVATVSRSLPARLTLVTAQPVDVPAAVGERVPECDHRDLRARYARAALVALAVRPNLHVSGLTVVLESMAMGKAVIATRTPGIESYLTDGVTGLLVEPGPEPLARAIRRLLNDPDGGRRSRRGRARGGSTTLHDRTTGRRARRDPRGRRNVGAWTIPMGGPDTAGRRFTRRMQPLAVDPAGDPARQVLELVEASGIRWALASTPRGRSSARRRRGRRAQRLENARRHAPRRGIRSSPRARSEPPLHQVRRALGHLDRLRRRVALPRRPVPSRCSRPARAAAKSCRGVGAFRRGRVLARAARSSRTRRRCCTARPRDGAPTRRPRAQRLAAGAHRNLVVRPRLVGRAHPRGGLSRGLGPRRTRPAAKPSRVPCRPRQHWSIASGAHS